jgi:MSHA biogenesis protein MshQ
MVATIAYRDQTLIITAPAGWALVNTVTQANGGANGMRFATYYRVASALEPASYTWSFSSGTFEYAVGGINSFSGVDTSAPINANGAQAAGNGTTRLLATPSITPTVNGVMLVGSFGYENADSWTPPASFTESVDVRSPSAANATGITLEMAYALQSTAAAVSATATFSSTFAADYGATQLLALKPAAAIAIDHVELVHDGSAVTCTPKAVTVLGCTTAASCNGVPANQIAITFPISVTAIAGATWCSDSTCTTTLSSPATVSNGTVIYLKDTNVRTDRMAGTSSSASNTTLQCSNTSNSTFNATTACDVAFAASGFLVSLPNHVSCNNATLTVQAVKSSNNGAQCTPAFTGTRSETVSFAYSNPTTGTRAPTVGGSAITTGGTSVSLTFDATGTATPTFNYTDVGRLSITVADAALNMTGSASGVVAPASFSIGSVTAGPISAGANFSATVTALNNCATPAATPNFGKETVAESVTLSFGSRVAPSGANDCTNGPCNGSVTGSVTLPWTNGAATASNLTYSEVGTMTLQATLASGSYLGSGLTATGTSATVGAFVPAHFDTAVTQGCASFSYSGQPFTVNVTARNTAGNTTVNYSSLAGCTVCSKAVTLQDPTATANFNGTNTVAASAFAKGVGSSNAVAYTLASASTAPTAITLRAIDSSVTPNVSSSGFTEGTTTVRSGRIRLGNANGSELLSLNLPLFIEYYTSTANGWQTSAGDTCSTLNAANFAFSFPAGGNNLQACETAVSLSGSPPNYTATLAKPGAGNNGWTDITLNLGAAAAGNRCTAVGAAGPAATTANDPWLQFNWTGAGAANPTARATFGVRRSGPVIYRSERY